MKEIQEGMTAAQVSATIMGNFSEVGEQVAEAKQMTAAEEARAKGAEQGLTAAVAQNVGDIKALRDDEVEIRGSVESLSEDLNAASEDISKLEVAIETETSRAKGAEQALSTEITEAENRVDERVTEIRDQVEQEVIRANSVEQALRQQIKANSESIAELEQYITGKVERLELLLSPTIAFRNDAVQVTSTVNFDTTGSLSILKDDKVIYNESNIVGPVVYSDNIENLVNEIVYTAKLVKNETTLEESKTLKMVDPIYIGGGNDYREIINNKYRLSARESVAGMHTVTLSEAGYIWFVIPYSVGNGRINSATMSGFDFPLTGHGSVDLNGNTVFSSVYRSANQLVPGTYKIVLS